MNKNGPRRYRDLDSSESDEGKRRGTDLERLLEGHPDAAKIKLMVSEHIGFFFSLGRRIGYDLGWDEGLAAGMQLGKKATG